MGVQTRCFCLRMAWGLLGVGGDGDGFDDGASAGVMLAGGFFHEPEGGFAVGDLAAIDAGGTGEGLDGGGSLFHEILCGRRCGSVHA